MRAHTFDSTAHIPARADRGYYDSNRWSAGSASRTRRPSGLAANVASSSQPPAAQPLLIDRHPAFPTTTVSSSTAGDSLRASALQTTNYFQPRSLAMDSSGSHSSGHSAPIYQPASAAVFSSGAVESDSAIQQTGYDPHDLDSFSFIKPDFDAATAIPLCGTGCEPWVWQAMPNGLMYRSYIAGEKEPRMALSILNRRNQGYIWEIALGGRVGLVRYGTTDTIQPDGWQLDIEGAGLPRLNQEEGQDLDMADYRFGIPITYRKGRWAFKFGYYHISSHVGDEFIERNPGFQRINYVRDSLILGAKYNFRPDALAYLEVGYAPFPSGGAQPLEFQFGVEYAPTMIRSVTSSPVIAVNGHLREEVSFGGGVNVIAGWQWRGQHTSHTFRMGLQYYNGKSMQYEFFRANDRLVGFGMWYDF